MELNGFIILFIKKIDTYCKLIIINLIISIYLIHYPAIGGNLPELGGSEGNGLSLSDIINEGNLGLIKAAKRFDPSRGFKFISYAVWWIRQAILQALAEQGRLIRLPLNRVGTITKITKAAEKLEAEMGRPPKVEEISHQLDVKSEEVFNALQYLGCSIC